MSVLDAVTRAMRSGRVITPREFPAIHREALATVDLTQMQSGDYLLRGEAAEALRGARFRNEAEQRTFFLSFLHQARDRVQAQLQSMLAAAAAEVEGPPLACFEVGADSAYSPAECFFRGGIGYGLRAGRRPEAGTGGFGSGLLRYLGQALPAHAFVSLPGAGEDGFFEIQLLDGIHFTAENFRDAALPADTRIHATTLRLLYRASVCAEQADLPDCR